MANNIVYTITVIAATQQPMPSTRTVGIFSTLELAQTYVTENIGDIHELWYEYVVIEIVTLDTVYSYNPKEYWYQWEHTQYVPITKPTRWNNIIGWGIG